MTGGSITAHSLMPNPPNEKIHSTFIWGRLVCLLVFKMTDSLDSPLPRFDPLKALHQPRPTSAKTDAEQIADIQTQLAAQRKKYEAARFRSLSPSQGLLHELRHEFARSLNKLVSLDTRDIAVRELRLIIERNVSQEALKVMLSCLGEHRKNRTPASREQEVLLIGFIAEVYETRLQDDLRTLVRMAELIHAYFKDLNRRVHEAAANALCQLYTHALPKDDLEEVMSFMFDPLFNIMTTGADVKSQQGAAVALFRWAESLASNEDSAVLSLLQPRVVALFLKLRPEFADIVSALGVLVDTSGFQFVVSELYPVLAKLLQYLKSQGQLAVNLKCEACKLLTVIGKHLQGMADVVLGRCHDEVIGGLADARTDRQPSVQGCARDALKEWERLRDIQRDVEEQKTQQEQLDPEELLRLKTEYAEMARYRPQAIEDMELSPSRKMPITSNFKALREMVKRRKSGVEGNPTTAKELVQIEDMRGQWKLSKPSFLAPVYAESRRPQTATVRTSTLTEQSAGNKRLPHKDVLAIIERRARDGNKLKAQLEPLPNVPLVKRPVDFPNSSVVSIERIDSDPRGRQFAEQEIEVSEQRGDLNLQPSATSLYSKPSRGRQFAEHEIEVSDPRSVFEVQPGSRPLYNKPSIAGPARQQDPRSLYGEVIEAPPMVKAIPIRSRMEDDEGTQLPSEENVVRYKHVFPQPQQSAKDLYRAAPMMQSVESVNLNPLDQTEESYDDVRPIRGIKPPQPDFLSSVKGDLIKSISEGLQGNLAAMQGRLETSFNAIETQLQKLDGRLISAHDRIEDLKPSDKSESRTKPTKPRPPQDASLFIEPKPTQVSSMAQTNPLMHSRSAQADSEPHPMKRNVGSSAQKLLAPEPQGSKDKIDSLTLMWLTALEHLHRDEVAKAYSLVLDSGDDLYLLRLMLKTGVVLEEMPKDLGVEVMRRLGYVMNSLFLENIGMDWVEDSYHIGLFDRLEAEDQQMLVEPLDRIKVLDCEEANRVKVLLKCLLP